MTRVSKLVVTPTILDEYVTFIQHKLPGLQDGTFELTVSQALFDKDCEQIDEGELANTYRFAVQGDRFRLAHGPLTLQSVFPGNNASGHYSEVLPHAVLTLPALPWARSPHADRTDITPDNVQVDADVPTWLAVLVFDEDDKSPDKFELNPVTGVIRDLFPQSALKPDQGKSTLGDRYSYFYDVGSKVPRELGVGPPGLELGESLDDPISFIDLPLRLFVSLAPTMADLELTAHVREVSIENKPLAAGAKEPDDPIGKFSIVVGTRLPGPMKKSWAYLVSLEGLAKFLPADEDGQKPVGASWIDMNRQLRLAVLGSWSFFSTKDEASFTQRLLALNGGVENGQDAPNINLRLDLPGATGVIKNALTLGYVPLNHDLRDGGNTVSWYRGPLSPAKHTPGNLKLPVTSPDAATAYDPTIGMLDVSLGAAWTIGRLVALQDTTFSGELYKWKRGLAESVVSTVETGLIDSLFNGLFPDDAQSGGDLAEAGDNRPLFHRTMALVGRTHRGKAGNRGGDRS